MEAIFQADARTATFDALRAASAGRAAGFPPPVVTRSAAYGLPAGLRLTLTWPAGCDWIQLVKRLQVRVTTKNF